MGYAVDELYLWIKISSLHLLHLTTGLLPHTCHQVLPKTTPIIFLLTNIYFLHSAAFQNRAFYDNCFHIIRVITFTGKLFEQKHMPNTTIKSFEWSCFSFQLNLNKNSLTSWYFFMKVHKKELFQFGLQIVLSKQSVKKFSIIFNFCLVKKISKL